MNRTTIKDKHFRVIGYIETRQDGVMIGKDASFRIVGYYDPQSNVTKDQHYRVIAHGDILASLITNAG